VLYFLTRKNMGRSAMKFGQTTNFAGSAGQFFLGSLALVVVTLVFFWFRADPAATAFAYLVVILLLSLMGSFTASILLSILAVAGLLYLLAPPLLHFWINDGQYFVVVAFSLTSLIVARLITGRKQTENALQQSNAYLAQAEELSRTGSFGWNVATGEIVWSQETFRIFECALTTRPTLDYILQRTHPEDRAVVRKTIDEVSADGRDFDQQFRLLMPDGSVKHLHARARARKSASGGIESVGAVIDVTAAKESEQKLRESEQRFRDYAETVSGWFWESGPDYRITCVTDYPNEAGIVASRLIGHLHLEIASDVESEPEKWRQHQVTLDAHLPFRDLVYRTISRTGASICVRVSGKPIFDAHGNFLGYRGVSTDVTAAIRADQAEQALRKVQSELAHVTRVTTLGELTASIAHEINQPLAAVVSNAGACISWLVRDPPDVGAARRSAEWIIEDSNRAGEVIRRVRALAKKSETEKVPLDVNDVVREVIALVQRELVSHAVSARLELAPTLPKIFGDRVQLQQVMINLVMNGIEAMESVSDRSREVVIRSSQGDLGRVIVTVTDCGIGIRPEIAERLFNPFFTTKSGGMGMGLSICRSIVEAHGGQLSVASSEGSGATFLIALPLHQEDACVVTEPPAAALFERVVGYDP
jgi:signal transduction histidine kinase